MAPPHPFVPRPPLIRMLPQPWWLLRSAWFPGMAAAMARPPSRRFPVLAQQAGQVGESVSVGGTWVALELELGQSAAILASCPHIRLSSSASRAFSFSSCRILGSIAYLSTVLSIVGCRLLALWPSPGRQGGKEFLLAAVDGGEKVVLGDRHGRSWCRRSRPQAIQGDQACQGWHADGFRTRQTGLDHPQAHGCIRAGA
jgi:hypothetical protein